MSFPSDFPTQAAQYLVKAATTKQADAGHIALSSYDLAGYILYLVFGDVKYLMQMDLSVLSDLPLDQIVAAQAKYQQLRAQGVAGWIIILKLVQEFGPVIVAFILKKLGKE